MAHGVSTQWYDLQVKHGNYLPTEKEPTLTQVQLKMQEKHEEENKLQNQLDKKTVQQIQQLEDDLDFEDQFTKQYLAKRMAEIKEKAQKCKYGKVYQISRDQYIRQVTQADPQSYVLLHLYQSSNQFCNLINQHLPDFAQRYGHVKIIKIISTKCIDNFPDSNCPCFIIYKGGKPIAHITKVDKHLKQKIQNLDSFLQGHGLLPL